MTALACFFLSGAEIAAAQYGGPTQVEVVEVVQESVAPTMRLTGTLQPQRRSVVASETSGLVDFLAVDVGDHVEQGSLICRLRDTQRRLDRDAAVARQRELELAVNVEEAMLASVEFERSRVARLQQNNQATEKEIINAQASYAATSARVEQARQAVRTAAAVAERAEYLLAQTEIRAPFEGFVTHRYTEVGAWIGEGSAVVDLIDISTVRVRVNVPEGIARYCTAGAPAVAHVDALDATIPGRIARVVPLAQEQARTIPIEFDLPNPDAQLKAGMFVRADVPAGADVDRMLVPKDAVMTRGPLKQVYVVRDSEKGKMAEVANVQIEAEVYDRYAVSSPGLKQGDLVVVRGNEYMQGPGPVVIMPSSGPPATTQPAGIRPTAQQPDGASKVNQNVKEAPAGASNPEPAGT